MSYSVGQLHKYSVDLYKNLEAETGQDVSFHVTGNLRLATNQERMDEYHKYCGTANTSPIHDKLDGAGAVWGQRYGWERPNWFAPAGVERKDDYSFRRSRYRQHVGNEHRALRERVGLIDITGFSKFLVSGPGAEAYLDRLVANALPKRIGRIALSHALTAAGGVRSEFTITRDGPEAFYLISSGAAERYDHDLLLKTQVGTTLEIEILRKRYTATMIEESPYDPENESLRA